MNEPTRVILPNINSCPNNELKKSAIGNFEPLFDLFFFSSIVDID
jgi:hypothetical protein